ncbi:hypothetical protein NPIL_582971 [Nephila pilipes]|uniref:Uncharacterized protein n=1 Tax=Nephila pilipes TaxID=299642 RepID=A0A8X6PBE2_NEPPI|nr:hypothetical protein NPIL_582971 [Nephila pilipes]
MLGAGFFLISAKVTFWLSCIQWRTCGEEEVKREGEERELFWRKKGKNESDHTRSSIPTSASEIQYRNAKNQNTDPYIFSRDVTHFPNPPYRQTPQKPPEK